MGLAQTGCTFNNLSVFNLIPSAPIPVLQLKVYERAVGKSNLSNTSSVNSFSDLQSTVMKKSSSFENNVSYVEPKKQTDELFGSCAMKNDIDLDFTSKDPRLESPKNAHSIDISRMHRNSNFPLIGSSPTAELEMDDDFTDFQSVQVTPSEVVPKTNVNSNFSNDDFTDFQSADIQADPLETVVITQKKEVPKIPLPKNLTGKLTNLKTNIIKISPESERKLKILSQPESLSSLPESKISSSNKVSTMPGIAVISSSRGIGSRLANHSLGNYFLE